MAPFHWVLSVTLKLDAARRPRPPPVEPFTNHLYIWGTEMLCKELESKKQTGPGITDRVKCLCLKLLCWDEFVSNVKDYSASLCKWTSFTDLQRLLNSKKLNACGLKMRGHATFLHKSYTLAKCEYLEKETILLRMMVSFVCVLQISSLNT